MKKKIIKEPKQNGLTMKQIDSYLKKAKGSKKFYWKGRKDSFKGSLRYLFNLIPFFFKGFFIFL